MGTELYRSVFCDLLPITQPPWPLRGGGGIRLIVGFQPPMGAVRLVER